MESHDTSTHTVSSPYVMKVLSCHCLLQLTLYSRPPVSGYKTVKYLVGYFMVLYPETGLKI